MTSTKSAAKIETILLIVMTLIFSHAAAAANPAPVIKQGAEHQEDFDGFRGSYDTLPAGIGVSKNGTDEMESSDDDFRGTKTNAVTTGGCYAWHIDGSDYIIGLQPTAGDFSPGLISLAVSNACGSVQASATAGYTVLYRNNADRSSRIICSYELNGTNFGKVASTEMATPEAADSTGRWVTVPFTFEIPEQLRPTDCIRIIWEFDDLGGSGSRDELGLDNITVQFHKPKGTAIMVR